MTEQEQQIAIAELCGWKWKRIPGLLLIQVTPPAGIHAKQRTVMYLEDALPDYLHDLNAIFAAEEVLKNHKGTFFFVNGGGSTSNIWAGYRSELNELLGGSWSFAREAEIFHATAAQRREAFLRATGAWKD